MGPGGGGYGKSSSLPVVPRPARSWCARAASAIPGDRARPGWAGWVRGGVTAGGAGARRPPRGRRDVGRDVHLEEEGHLLTAVADRPGFAVRQQGPTAARVAVAGFGRLRQFVDQVGRTGLCHGATVTNLITSADRRRAAALTLTAAADGGGRLSWSAKPAGVVVSLAAATCAGRRVGSGWGVRGLGFERNHSRRSRGWVERSGRASGQLGPPAPSAGATVRTTHPATTSCS